MKDIYFAYRSFWPEFEAMKQFKEAGVDTVCVFAANTFNSLGTPYSAYPPVWRGIGKYDFESLDKQHDDVLAVNGEAEFICMIDLNTPIWLHRQLAARGQSSESESFTMLSCACANPNWRSATTDYLEAMIQHLEARYGDRVKAYLLACGMTDEWMDYSAGAAGPAKARAWKEWNRAHGKAERPVPAPERLEQSGDLLRDPATELDIVDYARFTGDLIADTVLGFAAKTRSLIPKQRQIGMFFGYILELAHSRLVWSGHLEYERLYVSPDIDFFISPGTYSDRPMGGGSGFMVPNGTRLLHGKNFLHEIDHRTPTYNCKIDDFVSIGWMVPWKDQKETDAGLKREFALATINQTSLWCFDMWGGVFTPPETMKLVEQSKRIWDKYTASPLKSRAEVALVVDPQSARYLNDHHADIAQIYQGTRNKLNRLGAPFEVFSFNDLPLVDLSSYKFFVFPGLFEVTPAKLDVLKRHVFNAGRAALFVHAPGLRDAPYGAKGITCVATYAEVTPAVLKRLAANAGVNIYCEQEVPVYANEKLLAIHSAEGGEIKVTLPGVFARVTELYSGKLVAENAASFIFAFETPDTRLFELAKG